MGAFLGGGGRSSKCIDLDCYAKVIKQPLISLPAVFFKSRISDMLLRDLKKEHSHSSYWCHFQLPIRAIRILYWCFFRK